MQRIRELRAERGLTQVRLAVAADMNPATLNRIEQGKANPNIKTLERLAGALGVGLVDLLEDESKKAQAPLWSDEQPEGGAFNFHEAREGLESYCGRWERLVSEGGLDDRAMQEFFVTSEGLIPVMDIALRAELPGLRRTTGLEGSELLMRSEIAQANERYLALFHDVIKAFEGTIPEILGGPEPAGSNVVSLQEARELRKRAAEIPNQMSG